jgi:hypothetical protein
MKPWWCRSNERRRRWYRLTFSAWRMWSNFSRCIAAKDGECEKPARNFSQHPPEAATRTRCKGSEGGTCFMMYHINTIHCINNIILHSWYYALRIRLVISARGLRCPFAAMVWAHKTSHRLHDAPPFLPLLGHCMEEASYAANRTCLKIKTPRDYPIGQHNYSENHTTPFSSTLFEKENDSPIALGPHL